MPTERPDPCGSGEGCGAAVARRGRDAAPGARALRSESFFYFCCCFKGFGLGFFFFFFCGGERCLVYFGNSALPVPPPKSREVLGHPRPYLLFTGPERPRRLLSPLFWVVATAWLLGENPLRKQKKGEGRGSPPAPMAPCPAGGERLPGDAEGSPRAAGEEGPAVSVEWAE